MMAYFEERAHSRSHFCVLALLWKSNTVESLESRRGEGGGLKSRTGIWSPERTKALIIPPLSERCCVVRLGATVKAAKFARRASFFGGRPAGNDFRRTEKRVTKRTTRSFCRALSTLGLELCRTLVFRKGSVTRLDWNHCWMHAKRSLPFAGNQ